MSTCTNTRMPRKKYYAVKKGGHGSPCIVQSWAECSQLVTGVPGAVFKGFATLHDAEAFLGREAPIRSISVPLPRLPKEEPKQIGEPLTPISNTPISNAPISNTPRLLPSKPLVVYTDGSCLSQGDADTSTWRAGAGVYVPEWNWKVGLSVPGTQTNNRGELFAIIWILERIASVSGGDSRPTADSRPTIEIHSDSNYVITNISSNNIKNLDLWTRLHNVMKKVNVIWRKVLAHSGVIGNEIADELAKKAAVSGDFQWSH